VAENNLSASTPGGVLEKLREFQSRVNLASASGANRYQGIAVTGLNSNSYASHALLYALDRMPEQPLFIDARGWGKLLTLSPFTT
jgi:hypothetical protein